MTLAKGTLLGPYEVDTLLGAGGMGEVYRARDTRLGRTVAIKVLLSGLTATPERRARFEREARVISALSDPHICALYDIGREGDVEYLVMEYLEGETLADRIARGRLPLSQVLRFGAEIALALQHAHRAGITHRDLKPGNIMITSSGVKLLDFGLAKLAEPERNSIDADAATQVNPLTAEGTVVGTVVYMAPEQLEGKAVDHRADIFALGCILYEMATAQRPFGGGSRAAISAAILSSDPMPIHTIEPSTPPALERIILTALEKSPDDRWQTAHDVARQLRWLSESSSSVQPRVEVARKPSRSALLSMLAAAALGGLLVWGITLWLKSPAGDPIAVRLQLALPDDLHSLPNPETPNFALSPDGRTLCFAGVKGDIPSLFLRRLDSLEARKVEGSDGATAPFWSSDGQWIGFSARGKLWKANINSGAAPEALADVWSGGAIASWMGGTILFADRAGGRPEIYRITDHGGTPVKVAALKKGEWRHTWPRLLPDGEHFLYWSAATNSFEREIRLASLDSAATSVLLHNVSQVGLLHQDQLVYVRDAKLVTQRFDVKSGSLIGEPVPVADDVDYFYPSGRGTFDAANGVVVYRTDTSNGRLVSMDRNGKARLIDDHGPFDDLSLSFSPDAKRAAVTVLNRATGLGDIWIYDLARSVRDRFTNDAGLALMPVWSPDGKSIVYSLAAGTLPHIFRRGLTASASEELTPAGTFQFPSSFSPDGSTLYYDRNTRETRADIFRLDMHTHVSTPLLSSTFAEADGQASPDGKWLAFVSDTSGAGEVYLIELGPGADHRVHISTNGGESPRWRHDGQELFYVSADARLMSVTPRLPGQWDDTNIRELFHMPPDLLRFDAAPDGQSFLLIEGAHGKGDAFFHVITGL